VDGGRVEEKRGYGIGGDGRRRDGWSGMEGGGEVGEMRRIS